MADRKNILYITSNISTGGGIERVISLNSKEFINRNVDVTIFSLFDSEPFYKFDESIKIISGKKMPGILSKVLYLVQIIIKNRFDAVICMSMTKLNLIVGLLLLFIPRGSTKFFASEHISFDFENSRFLKKLRIFAYRQFDKVVWLTMHDMSLAKEYIENSIVIRNPIVKPSSSYNIESRMVLSVGHLIKRKGFDRLINIWSSLPEYLRENWKLCIVGDGPEKLNLVELINSLGLADSVIIANSTYDIDSYYKCSAIFALTSHAEGLPMVLLESLSYGVPIISYDCLTGPAEIVEGSYNGFLVNDDDSSVFLTKLKELMEDEPLRIRLSANCSDCSEKYTVDKIVTHWSSVIFDRTVS